MAGKNESGKTAILEALEDFTVEKKIREEAKPIHNPSAKPEIEVVFNVSKEILDEIFEKINHKHTIPNNVEIEIKKSYPDKYSMSDRSKELLGMQKNEAFESARTQIEGIYAQINQAHKKFPGIGGTLPKMDYRDMKNLKVLLSQFKRQTQPNLAHISDTTIRNSFIQKIDELISKISDIENEILPSDMFIEELKDFYIPNFILFSSFDDIFPSEISFIDAEGNKLIQDLIAVSDLNLELIKSAATPAKIGHKDALNLRITEDYRKFWTQDMTNLHIDWDSEKLFFHIKDGNLYYPPSLRSKGKQWHLAFYVRVSARATEDVPNVILIDEPGLFLHAKAQTDILKKLEDSALDIPIVFSTHSPYLMEIDKLNRIRLVSCTNEGGTIISNKIHKGADKETLTPIITAIGLDLSLGLDIAKDNNIILEGITDYYYLCAFSRFLNYRFNEEIHFIPGVGADKSVILISLMIGWGLKYCVVLDTDKKGRDVAKKLKVYFSNTDISVIPVSENKDDDIEDLFERIDFIKYVLNEETKAISEDKKNSQIIKKNNAYDKVLIAKKFFEEIDTIGSSLSSTTKENFKNLLEKINNRMFQQSNSGT